MGSQRCKIKSTEANPNTCVFFTKVLYKISILKTEAEEMTTEMQGCYHVARNSMSSFLSDFTDVIKQRPVLSLCLAQVLELCKGLG